MKKIIFRDQPFYVDVFIHPDYSTFGNFITVYNKIERTGFWSFLGPKYIQIYKSREYNRTNVQSRDNLIDALTVAWEMQQDNVAECIQCSPEIEALYSNNFSRK